MLSRVGGHVGPPTSSETETDHAELLPRRSSSVLESQSVCIVAQVLPQLGSPCVLASYILSTRAPFDYPVEMTLEPRYTPRTFRRVIRRVRHPYRLLSIGERMHRDRSNLPSQTGETSVEGMVVDDLPIILSNSRRRYPDSFTQWQADEPQIIITSDVQLQTDDTSYESITRPLESETAASLSSSSRSHVDFDASVCLPPAAQNSESIHGFQTTDNRYSTIQILSEAQNSSEAIDEGSEVPVINTENEQSGTSEAPYKIRRLYARLATIASLPNPTLASRLIATKVIRHARYHKTLDAKELHCLNCDLLPVLPVTGICGHTRCTNCIQINGACPCGVEAPKNLHVNTAVQHLILKIMPNDLPERTQPSEKHRAVLRGDIEAASTSMVKTEPRARRSSRYTSGPRAVLHRLGYVLPFMNDRMPMSTQARFEHATRLLSVGRRRDAAPHYARVAASSEPYARLARHTLAQIIEVLAKGRQPRRIAKDLFYAVRRQSAASCLAPRDMECVLCYSTYSNPVTTPCGHTYCRTCIERALDYRKLCALCLRPLADFNLPMTKETKFVCAALDSIGAYKPPKPFEPDIIPIFVCTVAFPAIPCPLFIFDPRYWLMIRRVLESDSRVFGMVAYESDQDYSDYGTILQIRDCVHLEDGRSLLSTVGVSRFKIIERDVRDGCDVARYQTVTDIAPTDDLKIFALHLMASSVLCKALMWVDRMNKDVRREIENAFGQLPDCGEEFAWHQSPDGPAWLWWLIAILPLRSEIKVLILSTRNLLKRITAVSRTLDVIDQAVITTTASTEYGIRSALSNADDSAWGFDRAS